MCGGRRGAAGGTRDTPGVSAYSPPATELPCLFSLHPPSRPPNFMKRCPLFNEMLYRCACRSSRGGSTHLVLPNRRPPHQTAEAAVVSSAGAQRGPPAVAPSSLPSSSIPGGSGALLGKDEEEAAVLSEVQATDEPTKFLVFAHHMYVVLGVAWLWL